MKKSITTLDLNLLLCLQLLMQERSVTKAAKRMNVTPSAVSKSLAKLRAWFDDPLFVNSPLGLSPTPLMVSMEQNLAEWMQMSNLLLDKPHHQTPRGLKFELAAESPLMMIMLNALSKRIYQRYPQATIKLRNWDYDSLDAITRGEVDIGFSGRESHPRSRELLSSLPLAIDYEVLFSDVPCVWLRKDHPALHEAWNLDTFTLSAYQHLLGTERYLGAGQCVTGAGARTHDCYEPAGIRAVTVYGSTARQSATGDRAALLPVLQSTPPTAVGCSSSPV